MTLLIDGFILIDDPKSFYIYAPIYGSGYAGVMTSVLATMAAHTAPSRCGFEMGVVTIFGWFGHANGSFMGGCLYDLTNDYADADAYGIATLAGALKLLAVATILWKIRGPQGLSPAVAKPK